MDQHPSRRDFLAASVALAGGAVISSKAEAVPASPGGPIRVVVWDERQPTQKRAYENFLGNRIADHLRSESGMSVKSVGIDDPGRGLGPDVLGDAQVLVWWGHVRHKEIEPEVGKAIAGRVKAGTLGLVALHSAHWSTPFVEAMNERSRLDAARAWGVGGETVEIHEIAPPQRYTNPKYDTRPTPYSTARKLPGGMTKVELHLPICCFPAWAHDAAPSFNRVLVADHPVAQAIPSAFELPQTEMYDETFHVPEPDAVIIEERWSGGQWFRSAMAWEVGKGKVVYYRPGHETYPIYQQAIPLKVVTNAVRWAASKA